MNNNGKRSNKPRKPEMNGSTRIKLIPTSTSPSPEPENDAITELERKKDEREKAKYKYPNAMECLFAKEYVFGDQPFNALQAAKRAGYKNPGQTAHKLLHKPHVRHHINLLMQDHTKLMIQKCWDAIEALEDIIQNSPDDRARVQAANSILDRSGYRPVERVEVSNERPMDRDGVASLLGQILSKLFGDQGVDGLQVQALIGAKLSELGSGDPETENRGEEVSPE